MDKSKPNPLMAKIFANALFPQDKPSENGTSSQQANKYQRNDSGEYQIKASNEYQGQSAAQPTLNSTPSNRPSDYLRSLTEIRRSAQIEPTYAAEVDNQRDRGDRSKERRRSRSKSQKYKKSSSKQIKYSQLIMEQNTAMQQYYPSPSNTDSEGKQRVEINNGEVYVNYQRFNQADSPHVHFADKDEILNNSQRVQGFNEISRESNNIYSACHSEAFPDILDALSHNESHQRQIDYPMTGVQEYELQMLDEKRRKLEAKIEKMDRLVHNENEEIVKREVELTEVECSN